MANGKIKVRGKKNKGNFVDFILEVQNDRDLLTRFMQITDPKDLKNFFDNEGFNDISEEDAVKILALYVFRHTGIVKTWLNVMDSSGMWSATMVIRNAVKRGSARCVSRPIGSAKTL